MPTPPDRDGATLESALNVCVLGRRCACLAQTDVVSCIAGGGRCALIDRDAGWWLRGGGMRMLLLTDESAAAGVSLAIEDAE